MISSSPMEAGTTLTLLSEIVTGQLREAAEIYSGRQRHKHEGHNRYALYADVHREHCSKKKKQGKDVGSTTAGEVRYALRPSSTSTTMKAV